MRCFSFLFYFWLLLFLCLFFVICILICFFFFSSRRRHTRSLCDWSSDVCSSDLASTQDSLARIKAAADSALKLMLAGRPIPTDRLVVRAALPLTPQTRYLIRVRRSEERRVGKECRSRGSPYHYKKKKE